MSLQVPVSIQLQRSKAYFYFYSPLQTVFSSPTVSDTTAVSTIDPARTTVKTYSLSIPSGADRIRVVIYGYVSGYTSASGAVYLNIDGVDVASKTNITDLTETILIDYIGSITPGSHVIKIDAVAESFYTTYITKVYITTGIGLTSTTPTTITILTLTYQLLRQGDIRYSLGVRVFVFGNRKTTASLTLTISEATDIIVGRNNLGAGNDNDKTETILAILTGSVTLQEGGEFTLNVSLRGNVGASGDIVIITRILARAQLRRETAGVGEVRVYERGVAEYFARALLVLVPGGSTAIPHSITRRDIQDRFITLASISVSGVDVTVHNYRIAIVTPVHFTASAFSDDRFGEAFLEWVQVVVWG